MQRERRTLANYTRGLKVRRHENLDDCIQFFCAGLSDVFCLIRVKKKISNELIRSIFRYCLSMRTSDCYQKIILTRKKGTSKIAIDTKLRYVLHLSQYYIGISGW